MSERLPARLRLESKGRGSLVGVLELPNIGSTVRVFVTRAELQGFQRVLQFVAACGLDGPTAELDVTWELEQ